MSFSGEVKEELSYQMSSSRHCQIAELSAIVMLCGQIIQRPSSNIFLKIQTENLSVARKYFTLLKKTFNIEADVLIKGNVLSSNSRAYFIIIRKQLDVEKIFGALKLHEKMESINSLITGKSCCKRAFIRGAFLASGSISDPQKFYHFEIACNSQTQANQMKEIINSFQMDAKVVSRKKYFVVYLKEGAQIVDILNVMEAHVALMNLENLRIVKEMRNSVNRRVNCETANINKTVSAAVKQLEDIKYIKSHMDFSQLSDPLIEIAEMRLINPEATLLELGEMLDPPVGKSGVNHRLRKLSDLADKLRG